MEVGAEAFQRGFVDRTEGFNLEEEDERVLKSLESAGTVVLKK